MPSKLGIHINFISRADELMRFILYARPAVVKTLHHDRIFWEHIKREAPEVLLVGRYYFEEQPLEDPVAAANDVAQKILSTSTAHVYDVWEGYNEIPRSMLKARCEFDVALAEILHGQDIKYACGSWSVGVPDIEDWARPEMLEALRAADYIAVHEYCAPTMNDPRGMDGPNEGWFTLRYRKWWYAIPDPALRKPVIITECGIDSGAAHWEVYGHGGWRSFTDEEGYLEQLKWYDEHLRRDHFVVGATIFCCGNLDPRWESYDLTGEMLSMLGDYIISVSDEEPPPPPPPPEPEPPEEEVSVELPKYFDLFLKHQIPELLPWYLLAAQCYWESGFDPIALSSAGAWGIAQFMPGTWSEWGLGGDPTKPEDAIAAQVRYLKFLLFRLAPLGRYSWRWLIAAYTWGLGNVIEADSWEDVPDEVRRHANRVIRTAQEYKRLTGEEE